MTRDEEFELALAQRDQAEKDARRDAHARHLDNLHPHRPVAPRELGRVEKLNLAFAALREEARP